MGWLYYIYDLIQFRGVQGPVVECLRAKLQMYPSFTAIAGNASYRRNTFGPEKVMGSERLPCHLTFARGVSVLINKYLLCVIDSIHTDPWANM